MNFTGESTNSSVSPIRGRDQSGPGISDRDDLEYMVLLAGCDRIDLILCIPSREKLVEQNEHCQASEKDHNYSCEIHVPEDVSDDQSEEQRLPSIT